MLHHLKISLNYTPVWREILVPSDLRLDRLHTVIQSVMGWDDCHLHEFSNGVRGPGELRFGRPMPGDGFLLADPGPPLRDERKATLMDLAPAKGSRFRYWYDFGDDWFHDVRVKDLAEAQPGAPSLRCLKAEGACPPEDCGGPPGYAHLLEVLRDPAHQEHEEVRDWIGDWDAERYDIAAVNRQLAALLARWSRPARKKARKGE
jgi:hypothetical protein